MSPEENIQTVKDFFAAIGRGDREGLLALVAEDIEWIIPGEDWPLAGTVCPSARQPPSQAGDAAPFYRTRATHQWCLKSVVTS
jgi:ketosteroid isomerase-like protein